MKESSRKKYEKKLVLWLTVTGIPLGVSIGIFAWIGLNLKIWLPISILIAFESGLITYLIFTIADIKDLKKTNKDLKKENRQLKKIIKKGTGYGKKKK